MKSFFGLFFKTLPFTIGIILILISLAFLTEFADQYLDFYDFEDETFWTFVLFAIIGIPTLLFGLNKASN